MSMKYLKSDSDFLPEKCSRRCNGGVDRISELPDEIILFILSFLSLRESVATGVLSSRWSDLWKHIPNLNLSVKLLTNDYPIQGRRGPAEWRKYIKIVNSVLQSHKAPLLKEFRITLCVNKSMQCRIAKWPEFVVSRQVETLELDLQYVNPTYMFTTFVSLEELLRDRPQNPIGFKSLKSLCLKNFKVSSETIDSFLRNCPLLEELYIHGSTLTSDIVVCGTALALKHLVIDHCYSNSLSYGEKSIKVCAPNLTWLRLFTSHKLVLENIPKLSSAEYSCLVTRPDYVKQFTSSVFSSISQLQYLTLNLSYNKVFFANAYPQMPMLKKLTVVYMGKYEHDLLLLTALIRASPRLQEFKLKIVPNLRSHSPFRNSEKHGHQHLKAFEFIGFSEGAGSHIELLKYVLDNSVALENIILNCVSWSSFVLNRDAQPRAARDRLEQLLNGKIADRIQLYIT